MAAQSTDLKVLESLTRAQLHAHATRYYKSGGRTEPEVALVVYGDARAVFKDYARTPGWFGRIIAPVLIWREASALRRLDGIVGVPQLYRQLDARGVLIEYLPATPWPQAKPAEAAYHKLDELVDQMHARGVAHCDLRAPSNMLVDEDGQPYIVDFVARVCRGRGWNLPWNWLFRQFVGADESALAKLRVRFAPRLATADDRARLDERGPVERIARAIGERTRAVVRFFVGS
ncbi:putative serine-threonine protein kinase [Salinisphaera shabanensis E1L3A]|uniref:Serine-threonine protein kinase n=1 Tax=Salinisphaera shabanensis E1L3A TaxID=1033802 RepID=U2EA71_9GAMM|nr:hypothetical protein [Salinisphaera shabanensis]ERJ20541.1 putative serine-threonine protein kinase [Salinisphaera shabanensis E1L3A]